MPTLAELDGTGFVPEDYAIDPVELWPENDRVFRLFDSISTQWRVSATATVYIGLDYGVMYQKMNRMKLSETEFDQLEADMLVIELEALRILNKKD